MLRIGFDRAALVAGITLFKEVSWSTTVVEQGHGSAASVHRTHRFYGPQTLSSRSMVHMMRSLLPSSSKDEAQRVARERKRTRLSRKVPERMAGRQVFLRELASVAKAQREEAGPLAATSAQSLVRMHSSLFRSLSDEARESYERMARHEVLGKRAALDDTLSALHTEAHLAERGLSNDRVEMSQQMRLSSCKLAVEGMAALWRSPDFSRRNVAALRAQATTPPKAPSLRVQGPLEAMEVQPPALELGEVPPWCHSLCTHRALFQNCALFFEREGREEAYLFLYALQSPRAVAFLALADASADLPPLRGPLRNRDPARVGLRVLRDQEVRP